MTLKLKPLPVTWTQADYVQMYALKGALQREHAKTTAQWLKLQKRVTLLQEWLRCANDVTEIFEGRAISSWDLNFRECGGPRTASVWKNIQDGRTWRVEGGSRPSASTLFNVYNLRTSKEAVMIAKRWVAHGTYPHALAPEAL